MIIRLALVACLSILPFAALHAQSANQQPTGTIDVTDTAEDDAAIAVRIRNILSELGGYEDVTVTVSSGIVTLRGTTLEAVQAARLNELASRVDGVVAIENEVSETTDVARRLDPALERFKKRMWQLVNYTPLLAVALLAFALVLALGIMIARMRNLWNRLAPNAFIADIYRQIIRLTFAIGGLVVALDILGATALLSTILGAAGIIGLAIGFAVRDTVENFIASVMLSIRQPFRPNDAIEIGGDEGKVIRLTSRATILLSYDGNHIRIPNSTVFKSRIVNFTRNPERRFVFDVGVGYGTDLAAAIKLATDTMNALPFVLDTPAVAIWTESLNGSDITLRMTAWINQGNTSLLAARGEAIRQILSAFEAAEIEMPEPTYRLLTRDIATTAVPTQAGHVTPVNDPSESPDVQAKAEHQLERIVKEEREVGGEEDLLKEDAPRE
ncbi:mechanosensitive ion channel [Lutimaribacter sp. EGI FJ00015]|uniref:Mechanosensitive ion channel n=1 Tax=Lutimaribacter degradans TaxID=2945989 RepID=A0ACC5ZVP5_9RHOB|nr:mechanosensitive ion channel family protein [Lutimaribacter sp. EGI FJ00013]MCM2561624.1 mechanosensitive ion channel [Lutimaribacter sp. EGI FJ00013]MCO0612665.1 mechanosensitive ion channel [Lutimaribacter sp. EGI FJ00015]MCO0635323.1 mechanosensitive ion channel [Lutimaribacter sp. EGI FJ00014]